MDRDEHCWHVQMHVRIMRSHSKSRHVETIAIVMNICVFLQSDEGEQVAMFGRDYSEAERGAIDPTVTWQVLMTTCQERGKVKSMSHEPWKDEDPHHVVDHPYHHEVERRHVVGGRGVVIRSVSRIQGQRLLGKKEGGEGEGGHPFQWTKPA